MTIRPWDIIKSDYLVKDIWCNVRADTCRTADGTDISPYYVMEYPDWIQVVLFDSNHRILMNRQYRHAARVIKQEIICGTVDDGEDPMETAKRELLEETGYTSDSFHSLGSFHPNPAVLSNRIHSFVAYDGWKQREPLKDPREEIENDWMAIEEVIGLIRTSEIPLSQIGTLFLALNHAELL